MIELSEANRITAPVARVAAIAMLAISQKPDRVSNILRSSTPTIRPIGIPSMRLRAREDPLRVVHVGVGGQGGHAAAPSREVSAVSSRNMSSRPAPSAVRSSTSGTPAARATLPTCSGSASVRNPSPERVYSTPEPVRAPGQVGLPRGADVGARGLQELRLAALRDDPAVADHDEVVGDHLDLVQQVRREQHGAALVGVVAEQVAHPADAGRVESVGRLVEDQHLRVADQRGGDPEALPHAQRVVAHAATCLGRRQADPLQHLVHPAAGQAHHPLGEREDLAAGAARVLGGGVEEDADLQARVGQVGEPAPADRRGAGRGRGEPDHDPHRRGLSCSVGPEEPGDATGVRRERDVVDGGEAAVLPVSDSTLIMPRSVAAKGTRAHQGNC